MSQQQELLEESILPLITIINNEFGNLNGMHKVALLKTVAAHFEYLTSAEAVQEIMKQTFSKL